MSIKLMAQVWEKEFGHAEQAIMLALADHASDDGGNCYPSWDRISWKTGYSRSQVARTIKGLIASGVLKVERKATQHQSTRYRICLHRAKDKPSFERTTTSPQNSQGCHGDETDEGQGCHPAHSGASSQHPGVSFEHAGVSSCTPSGITMTPKTSVNHQNKTLRASDADAATSTSTLPEYEEPPPSVEAKTGESQQGADTENNLSAAQVYDTYVLAVKEYGGDIPERESDAMKWAAHIAEHGCTAEYIHSTVSSILEGFALSEEPMILHMAVVREWMLG